MAAVNSGLNNTAISQPQHGGDLQRAMAHYGGGDWIDCSSGIAPWAYPLPAVPEAVWQRLPDQEDALLQAAQNYYGCDSLLAVDGSQAAIALLPKLRPSSRVGIVSPAYAEHHWQWQQAGHRVSTIASDQVGAALAHLDVLVVVNPNNPSAEHLSAATLLGWHQQLAARGGWLIVDEAFADCATGQSLLPQAGQTGLIILRSLGKFFGLAGVRLGFVAAGASMQAQMAEALGPWPVSGPAQWAGIMALNDTPWQTAQQQRLLDNQQWMQQQLSGAGLAPAGSLPLLHWCPTPYAVAIHKALAREKIWCRLFDAATPGLRFGPVAEGQQALFKTRLMQMDLSR